MTVDKFAQHAATPDGVPVRSVVLDVSTGDHELSEVCTVFWCSTPGDLIARLKDDKEDRRFVVMAGQQYRGRFAVVRKSGTTAAGLFLYPA